MTKPMQWVYGITTVPERRYNYLPTTIESLKRAGFNSPTIFVDGPIGGFEDIGLPVVYRSNKIRAYGNWFLALMELWIRNPKAHRYSLFQDDFVTYPNLRSYLEQCELPDDGYWNMYTFPQNEALCEGKVGWYLSNQMGRGAVALTFSNRVVFNILTNHMMVAKPAAETNGHRSIDGILVTALAQQKIREYVHFPTLVQHTGECSSIGNRQHTKPESFMGENYDALNLFTQKVRIVQKCQT